MANFRSGYLTQGQPLGQTSRTQLLSADNQNVLLMDVARIDLVSDNTTATNRTFTLEGATLDGYVLELVLISGSSTTCELADSGNVRLASAWTPSQWDTLVLQWSAVAGAWLELSRTVAGATDIALAQNHIFVGNASGVATDVAMSGDVAIVASGATTIQAGAVGLSKLATAVAPSHVVKFAANATTVGGSATEAFTVTGAATTDLVYCQMKTLGTGSRTILTATISSANTLTVVFSGDPSNNHVFAYQVLRATS